VAVLYLGSACAQTVKYSALATGTKLPYGKNVTITGDLSDLKCGTQQKIVDFLNISAISVSYLGQTSAAATATVTGTSLSVSLGSLPADTAVNLQFKITGKMTAAVQNNVMPALVESDQFRRALDAFFQLTVNQPSSVVNDEAARLLRSVSDSSGALTKALQSQLSCVSITDVTAAAVAGLQKNLPSLVNLNQRLADLKARKLDGLNDSMTVSEASDFITGHLKKDADYQRGGAALAGEMLKAAKASVDAFSQDCQAVRNAFAFDLVAQLNQAVLIDLASATTDLQKYAGFDVGAAYVPRINELREFFMINIYPWGPVGLDTQGLISKDWEGRFSLAVGFSLADLSSNAHSRVKGESAFMYGLGYRINKYFRLNVGGVMYRDAGAGNGLLNEFSIGPSIDLSALPGLKQLFASASGGGTSGATTSGASPPAAGAAKQ
jgi:hypothetical protein